MCPMQLFPVECLCVYVKKKALRAQGRELSSYVLFFASETTRVLKGIHCHEHARYTS